MPYPRRPQFPSWMQQTFGMQEDWCGSRKGRRTAEITARAVTDSDYSNSSRHTAPVVLNYKETLDEFVDILGDDRRKKIVAVSADTTEWISTVLENR